jgi:hypothetical protein
MPVAAGLEEQRCHKIFVSLQVKNLSVAKESQKVRAFLVYFSISIT